MCVCAYRFGFLEEILIWQNRQFLFKWLSTELYIELFYFIILFIIIVIILYIFTITSIIIYDINNLLFGCLLHINVFINY